MINKIKGVGLDTSNIGYKPSSDYCLEFTYINLRSNNAFLFDDFIEPDSKIIVGADFTGKNLMSSLQGLLYEIGRSKVDVLLLSCPISEEVLLEICESEIVDSIGIKHPESLEEAEKIYESVKKVIIPKYLSLDISPIHFQKELIDWAEREGLDILGFNPLGGLISSQNLIQSFTIPGLLGFAARYSVVVFLSGRDIVKSYANSEFLSQLIGLESPEIYKLGVSVNQTQRPFKKMYWTALKTAGGEIIPYDDPDSLFSQTDLVIKMKEIEEKIGEEGGEIPESIKDIYEFIKAEKDYSEEEDVRDLLSIIRPSLVGKLSEEWKVEVGKLSSSVFILKVSKIVLEKRVFKRSKKHELIYNFLFTINKNGNIIFKNIENSDLGN